MSTLTEQAQRARKRDRGVGAVLGSAAGDALGSHYEFRGPLPDEAAVRFGPGVFGHAPGEWTDDTSMAVPILQALARGNSLGDPTVLARIALEWREWSTDAKDVGNQTRAVLSRLPDGCTEDQAREVSRAQHARSGRSGGNGSLMRTGPAALGYLDDGAEDALVDAAGRLAQLTHWEDDNVDACVLWSLAIRHAIRTGELDVRAGLAWVPDARRERWSNLIDAAIRPDARVQDFRRANGRVTVAFQGALCAVSTGAREHAHSDGATGAAGALRRALELAVRGGGDTDTVAAIAGSLAGAVWGGSAVPLAWRRILHGWPGLRGDDLADLASLAMSGGEPSSDGWPLAARLSTDGFLHTPPVRHPHDDGVWLGSLSALRDLPATIGAVVSLCRVGREQVPAAVEGVRVWLIDTPGYNANLDHVLTDAADTIATLRAEGTEVFVHCAEARSRTAAVAALYGIRHRGIQLEQAWRDVQDTLPHFDPAPFLRDAVTRLTGG